MEGLGAKKPAAHDAQPWPSASMACLCTRRGCCIVGTLSLFVLLIVCAAFQYNDGSDAAMWMLFYAVSALVQLFAFGFAAGFHHRCGPLNQRRSVLVLQLVVICMLLWSVVLLTISIIRIANTEYDGTKANKGGDNPNAMDEDELVYELAGAALTLLANAFAGWVVEAYRSLIYLPLRKVLIAEPTEPAAPNAAEPAAPSAEPAEPAAPKGTAV